ncbi:MAG: cell wall-binding protein [Clostridium sp.]|nr:cell wall-binding protein [Clostridium sp.]
MTVKKLVSLLGISLCLGILGTGTVFGDQAGWKKEGDVLKYVDSKGNYVTNDWKDKDGKSYYLGSEGEIEKNTWIANTYYVDEEGAMVKNAWIRTGGKDGLKEEGWYFLGKDGKAEEDGWKNIGDGRYSFDSDGRMRSGWFYDGDNIYYLGGKNDGAMKKGWLCLEFDEEKLPEEGAVSREYKTAGDKAKWFYFQSNGRAKRASQGSLEAATIDGSKYYFDQNGVMLTGWQAVKDSPESGDKTGISRFVYLGGPDDGNVVKNRWLELSEHPGTSEHKEAISDEKFDGAPLRGEKAWYYFENNGTPAYLKATAVTMNGAAAKIDGESYFLDPFGCRKTGLVKVVAGQNVLVGYFGPEDGNGRMRTGRNAEVPYEEDGPLTCYFTISGSNKGAGYTGEKDGFLYYQGILVKAEAGQDYEAFKVDNKTYLVNEGGKVQTDNKAYRSSGEYAYVMEGGTVYQADNEGVKAGRVEALGTLPLLETEQTYQL